MLIYVQITKIYRPYESLVTTGHMLLLRFENYRKAVNAAGQGYFQQTFRCSSGLNAFSYLVLTVPIRIRATTVNGS